MYLSKIVRERVTRWQLLLPLVFDTLATLVEARSPSLGRRLVDSGALALAELLRCWGRRRVVMGARTVS